MKTKDLIKALQEADPSGELYCCVGNEDIFTVHVDPAYWDGRQQILILDENNEYYNVIGAKVTSEGHKVVIRTHSIEDAIWSNPDLPIDLSGLGNPDWKEGYSKAIEKWRKEAKDGQQEIERMFKNKDNPKKLSIWDKIKSCLKT